MKIKCRLNFFRTISIDDYQVNFVTSKIFNKTLVSLQQWSTPSSFRQIDNTKQIDKISLIPSRTDVESGLPEGEGIFPLYLDLKDVIYCKAVRLRL